MVIICLGLLFSLLVGLLVSLLGCLLSVLSAQVERCNDPPYAGFLKLCNASVELSHCRTPVGLILNTLS